MGEGEKKPSVWDKALKWLPWAIIAVGVGALAYTMQGCGMIDPGRTDEAAAAAARDPVASSVEESILHVFGAGLPWLSPLLLLLFKRVRENMANVGVRAVDLGKAMLGATGVLHTEDAKTGAIVKDAPAATTTPAAPPSTPA